MWALCYRILAARAPEVSAPYLGVVAVGAGPHLAEHVPLVGVAADDLLHAAHYLLGDYLDVVLFIAGEQVLVGPLSAMLFHVWIRPKCFS